MSKKLVKTVEETSATPETFETKGSQSPEDKVTQMNAAREARESRLANDKFGFIGESMKDGKTFKLAPQAQAIVDIIKNAEEPLTRKELVEAMGSKVTTRQPMGRILTYYQKQLVQVGAIEIVAG